MAIRFSQRSLWLVLGTALMTNTCAAGAQSQGADYQTNPEPSHVTSLQVPAFLDAAKAGNVDAQILMGDIYSKPMHRVLPLDYHQALKWYELAAAQQSPVAILRLGQMHEMGLGVQSDAVTAFQCYKKAASTGMPEAQYLLGKDYLFGHGVTQNHQLAVYWLKNASKQGYVPAQVQLGTFYMDEHSVNRLAARDPVTAYAWLSMAAGDSSHPMAPYAEHKREVLRGTMTMAQILEAEQRDLNVDDINGPALPTTDAEVLVNAKIKH